jgi:hypothetical protein
MDLARPLSKTAARLFKPVLFLCIFVLSASLAASYIAPPEGATIIIDNFSQVSANSELPEGWKILTLPVKKRLTKYTVDTDGRNHFLKAESHQSASAIYKEMPVDLKQYPLLSWSWKVSGTLKKGDAHFKKGDDYPARIYAAFEFQPDKASAFEKIKQRVLKSIYGVEPPGNTITYIWANKLPKNAALQNAFSDRMMMIAVESGNEKAGSWVEEERNIYEDYKRFFNEEPPMLRGIIVMTDTDNTQESAQAWYDDIMLKKKF